MREKEKMRVIWRHPQGRFEIQETEHYSLFDHCTYYTRECVFTPQDDARDYWPHVQAEARRIWREMRAAGFLDRQENPSP